MIKIKYAVSLLLLLLLTCGVVFAPQFINRQSRNALYDKTVFRTYNAGKRTTVTDRQVAELFSNNKIALGFAAPEITGDESKSEATEACLTMLKNCFVGENTELYEKIKNMLSGNNKISYLRSGSLIKLGEIPVALNLIEISFKDDSGFLDILYEEKTNALLNFSLGIFRGTNENNESAGVQKDIFTMENNGTYSKLGSDAKDYFENHLGLKNYQYYTYFAINEEEIDIDLIQFGVAILPYGEIEKITENF